MGLWRIAQAAEDPATAPQPLATPAAGVGWPAGAAAAGAAHGRAGPAGHPRPPPLSGPGSRRPAIRNSNPEEKSWEACQLSFENRALGEAEI